MINPSYPTDYLIADVEEWLREAHSILDRNPRAAKCQTSIDGIAFHNCMWLAWESICRLRLRECPTLFLESKYQNVVTLHDSIKGGKQ